VLHCTYVACLAFRTDTVVDSENRLKIINTSSGRNVELFDVAAGDICLPLSIRVLHTDTPAD
jgi:hypothetical protein